MTFKRKRCNLKRIKLDQVMNKANRKAMDRMYARMLAESSNAKQ